MWTETLWDHGLQPLQWAVVLVAGFVAAVWDVRTRRIPNWLTFPVLVGGLIWSFAWAGPNGIADAAAACAVLMLPFVVLFVVAGGGAGDAKLMGAIGAWLGLVNGLVALAGVSVAGLMLAIGYAVAGRQLRATIARIGVVTAGLMLMTKGRTRQVGRELVQPTRQMQAMPYGLAIFAGTCLAAIGVLVWRISH